MIEIKKPVIPERIEEHLIEARKEAERATRNDIRWDIEDIIQFAKKTEVVKEWFGESPENMEEFIFAFFYSYEVTEEIFYLIYQYPDFLSVGAKVNHFLNYNTYDEIFELGDNVNSEKYKTMFTASEVKELGIDTSMFKKMNFN